MEAFTWIEGEIQIPEGMILVTAMLNGDGIATLLKEGADLTDGLHWEDENGFPVTVPSIKELTHIERLFDWEAKKLSAKQDEAIAKRMQGTAIDLVTKKHGVAGMRAMTAHSIAYQAEANKAGEPAKKSGGMTIDADMLDEVLNRFNTVCTLATRLCHELEDHPDRAAREFNTEELLHHSVSDYSTEIRQELHDLVADLKETEPGVIREGSRTPRVAAAVVANLAGALGECMEQISQMKGMFDDADGAIQRAIESGDAALKMHRAAIQSTPSEKIVVVIEGGMVREVLSANGGFSVAVIDYDDNADIDDLVVIPQGDGEKNAYALAAIHEPAVTDAARVDELYSAVVEAKPAAEDEDSPRPRP